MNESPGSTDTRSDVSGLAPSSDGGSRSLSSYAGSAGRVVVQLVSLVAIWDLARLDKVPGTHALIAFGAIAAPALTVWLLSKRISSK